MDPAGHDVFSGGCRGSFKKYGNFEGERNGRYFTDMTEDKMENLLNSFPEIKIEKQWITGDVRAGRGDERWLNMILRK